MTKPGKIRLGEKHEAHVFLSVASAKRFARQHGLTGYRVVCVETQHAPLYAIALSDDNDPETFEYVLGVH